MLTTPAGDSKRSRCEKRRWALGRGNELRAAEADSGEAVGAVAVREAAERAGRVERDRRVDRRIDAEGRLRREKVACDVVVFLGLERAGRVDEPAARLHHRRGRGEDLLLSCPGAVEVLG